MRLAGRLAWVTGAGSGIGAATAEALAAEGAELVLTGRRAEALDAVAARIAAAGGTARTAPADLTDAAAVQAVAGGLGRLDILVNNAGVNVLARDWARLTPEAIDTLLRGNLAQAMYCVAAALPLMRVGGGGAMIHVASMAGRTVSPLSGPGYTAAKHGLVAMSHSLNMEECMHGIRSTAICPGEVATPILDQRPNPVPAEERARMLQPADVAALVVFVATLPPHVTLNEAWITPTHNRGYIAAAGRRL